MGSNALQLEQIPSKFIPFVTRPIEILSGSAVAVACVSTAIDEILGSFTIPAGTLGPNSGLQFEALWQHTNSATAKILKIKVGGTEIYNPSRTTSLREAPLVVLANRNSLQSQISPYSGSHATASGVGAAVFEIDFSNNITIEFTGNRASGSDTLKLEYYRVLHFVGD